MNEMPAEEQDENRYQDPTPGQVDRARSSDDEIWVTWPYRENGSLKWESEEWRLLRDGRWYTSSRVSNEAKYAERVVYSQPGYLGFPDGILLTGIGSGGDCKGEFWRGFFDERTAHTKVAQGYCEGLVAHFDKLAAAEVLPWHGFWFFRSDEDRQG